MWCGRGPQTCTLACPYPLLAPRTFILPHTIARLHPSAPLTLSARPPLVQVPALTPSGAPMKALSNMPLKDCTDFDLNTTDGQPAMLVEFQVTPLMSPYLLAVAAGGMVQYTGAEAAVPGNSSSSGGCSAGGGSAAMFGGADGLPVLRFWAAPGLEGQLAAAAEVAPKAFSFYRSYLGVDLPEQLTKMDLLAVPGKSGAMEVRRALWRCNGGGLGQGGDCVCACNVESCKCVWSGS